MKISTVKELMVSLREGKFSSVGGYPKFWVTEDGGVLSIEAIKENLGQVARAVRDRDNAQWRVVAVDINWEDPDLTCDHTNQRIEAAYV